VISASGNAEDCLSVDDRAENPEEARKARRYENRFI